MRSSETSATGRTKFCSSGAGLWCAVAVTGSWLKYAFWIYLLFLVAADATVKNPADPDLWHRLALGEALWKTGQFPSGDTFSYLADYRDVADHEWGSAVIFYGLYLAGGTSIFVATKVLTLGTTLVLTVRAGMLNRKPTAMLAAFYALILLALLPSFQSTVRCMVFTHIFFALWLYWFQGERQGRGVWTGWYVVSMVVWANLHGGFTIGLAWLFVLAALGVWQMRARCDADPVYAPKKWAIRLGLCTLATLINPFGVQLWFSTARALTTTRQGFAEWAPVSWWTGMFDYPGYKILLIVLVVGVAIRIGRTGWKRMDQPAVLFLALFAALSLSSARHTSLFALVAGAFAPGLFPPRPKPDIFEDPIRRLGGMALSAALLLTPLYSVLIFVPGEGLTLGYDSASCPVAAVEFLQERKIEGKLLVTFNYGSYALWELRGKMRVSMDGRYDLVYRPETYRRVDDFFFARGNWQSLLTSPAPDAILVPMTAEVYPKLKGEAGWTEAWENGIDAVFLPR